MSLRWRSIGKTTLAWIGGVGSLILIYDRITAPHGDLRATAQVSEFVQPHLTSATDTLGQIRTYLRANVANTGAKMITGVQLRIPGAIDWCFATEAVERNCRAGKELFSVDTLRARQTATVEAWSVRAFGKADFDQVVIRQSEQVARVQFSGYDVPSDGRTLWTSLGISLVSFIFVLVIAFYSYRDSQQVEKQIAVLKAEYIAFFDQITKGVEEGKPLREILEALRATRKPPPDATA